MTLWQKWWPRIACIWGITNVVGAVVAFWFEEMAHGSIHVAFALSGLGPWWWITQRRRRDGV